MFIRVNCLHGHALTIFIKDARWFKLFNKPRRRRSTDGSEFRKKFSYVSESTIRRWWELFILSLVLLLENDESQYDAMRQQAVMHVCIN
jgi:hypothetical protein